MSTHTRLMLPFDDGDIALPDTGDVVILRANGPYPDFPKDRLICVQGFFPTHTAMAAAGYTVTATAPDTAAMVILHITRSKDETRALVAQAYDMVPADGLIVIDGDKTNGVESLLKTMKKLAPIDGQTSKSHGKVFWLRKSIDTNPFADWRDATTPRKTNDGWMTAAGVFSADGIDPGSAELAATFDPKIKGKVADLGAGWGWLSAQLLGSNTAIERLDLIEAEHAALDCARLNITDPRATFHWADATRPSQKNAYDWVISNPPFHTGRKADPSLGRAFIQSAATQLKPTGQLLMVANRQLAYEATLDTCFARWEVTSQSSRYKIIHARKPRQ